MMFIPSFMKIGGGYISYQ